MSTMVVDCFLEFHDGRLLETWGLFFDRRFGVLGFPLVLSGIKVLRPPNKMSNFIRKRKCGPCAQTSQFMLLFSSLWGFTMKGRPLYKKESKKILWDQTLWENKSMVQSWQRREGDSLSKEVMMVM